MLTTLLLASVLAAPPEPRAVPGQASADLVPVPGVREVMERISAERIEASVSALAGLGTRHTLSDTTSGTRGIGAARAWVVDQLGGYARQPGADIACVVEEFDAPPGPRMPKGGRLGNVIATVPGAGPAGARRVYLVAHLDSRCEDVMDATSDAPGANDDGSGVAALLEIARVAATTRPDATLVFVFSVGEEQGLVGARHRAEEAAAGGERIVAVLNNDIIGDPTAPAQTGRAPTPELVRVFSEGVPGKATAEELGRIRALGSENDSPSRQLARYVGAVARAERTEVRPMLVFRPDRFLRGGDHTPFLEHGYPAVRFTELDEDYAHQHANVTIRKSPDGGEVRGGDLPEYVDARYIAGVARLNAAVLTHLARAPGAPGDVRIVTDELRNDTLLRWSKSPDAAGYEVVWRDTTASDWTHALGVGDVDEARIPLSADDCFFGVRALGKSGVRGVVQFAGAGKK